MRAQVQIDMPDELELKRIRHRIEESIGEIRSTGAKVEIVKDYKVAVVVLVSPLRTVAHDSENWGALREPSEMWIDPGDYVAPFIRLQDQFNVAEVH